MRETIEHATIEELLERLNTLDEDVFIEAKLDRRKVGKSTRETICAFANTEGGWVVMGVEKAERDGSVQYIAVGVDDSDKIQNEFASMCASQLNIPLRPRIVVKKVEDALIVAGYIAEAPDANKPIYVESMGLSKGAFVRSGSGDQRCTDDEIARFFQKRDARAFDTTIVRDADMDDLDTKLIGMYRETLQAARSNHDISGDSDHDLMRDCRAAARDSDGVLRPTVAGILLFGRPRAIGRVFPLARVDYMSMAGKEWVEDPIHRFSEIDIQEPILRALPRAYNAFMSDIPKAMSLEHGELRRIETASIPETALREAIANALIHRDYQTHSTIQVRKSH